ncbi:MAG TPA: metallophosphoesterase [Burkholderiales bacterium]|nr:metallophosphoesterase [Burkholderiales bacterium]
MREEEAGGAATRGQAPVEAAPRRRPRELSPFVLALTGILAIVYSYLALRIASGTASRLALAVPFVLIWLVPVIYWVGDRERRGLADDLVHLAGYLSMGWLSFVLVLSLARDALLLATAWVAPLAGAFDFLRDSGADWVLIGSLGALAGGALAALRGPRVRRVDIPVAGLDPALEGVRIVQITDLHVGPAIRAAYVNRVVRKANELDADLVAVTGDLVDGRVERLARHVAALAELRPAGRVYFVPGNHEYYSGAGPWLAHFRSLGFTVLLNEHATLSVRGARIVVGGVLDPAARVAGPQHVPRPDLAAGPEEGPAFRLLLAHNPKVASLAQTAGFDLQLSGHTHAGQFFPWTLAVRLIHAPHVAGLSRSGRMWVYVSAGTGSWGPPIRLGSEPELTLIRLVAGKRLPIDRRQARRPSVA